MYYIEIKGMKFHSFIGHYDEEKQIGNKFNVDIKVEADCEISAQTDKLENALDYVKLYSTIKEEMQKKCNLLENVIFRLKSIIFKKFSSVKSLELKITKLSPKIGGMVDEVSVIINEKRE